MVSLNAMIIRNTVKWNLSYFLHLKCATSEIHSRSFGEFNLIQVAFSMSWLLLSLNIPAVPFFNIAY